jgi:2-phospho-L-lactate/phosphoenolpyruvate guanylyltransferase
MKALLIPLKDPSNAKTRLAGLLNGDERRRLAWAMFEDVTLEVAGAETPDAFFVVSSYQPAIDYAREMKWQVLVEETQVSESASVDWASSILEDRGFDAVMRLPADIPLVQAADIDGLFSLVIPTPGAVLVPSREGTGTNAIIRRPASLFPSRFGPNSLALHRQEAARVGVRSELVENARIALDIDEPADVDLLLEAGGGSRTLGVLRETGLFERLKQQLKQAGLSKGDLSAL